jgi:hypothetical protein
MLVAVLTPVALVVNSRPPANDLERRVGPLEPRSQHSTMPASIRCDALAGRP